MVCKSVFSVKCVSKPLMVQLLWGELAIRREAERKAAVTCHGLLTVHPHEHRYPQMSSFKTRLLSARGPESDGLTGVREANSFFTTAHLTPTLLLRSCLWSKCNT